MADKTERLLNLIALLLETRRPLSPDEIREKIPGYGEGDVAFRRMFERDKEDIRELGLPLELVPTDAWEGSEGYRIRKEAATIPELDLTADERAALLLAAQAWEGQAVPGDPDRALMKLSLAAGASDDDAGAPTWFHTRVDASAPVLGSLFDAIERRKRVTFRYRTGGGGEAHERSIDPYGLRHRGSWYLAGFDHDRGEVRHFKLDRIEGAVTLAAGRDPDFDPPKGVATEIPRGPWAEGGNEARVAFAPDAAWWVARRTGADPSAVREDAWVEVSLPYDDRHVFLSWILGFGEDAVVLAPDDLRDEAVARLRAAAGER
ncbi:MAG: helix-turn-helix transcriptional regulator [Actinomycetota bacterium]